LFVLLYINRPRGITLTIAEAIGLRVFYNVVYKGDNNESVNIKVLCRRKWSFFVCFKVL